MQALRLQDNPKNTHSQWGEDSILENVFREIGVKWYRCMEFGAYDGISMSNTATLWQCYSWKPILVEADPQRYRQLLENGMPFHAEMHCLKVESHGPTSPDAILGDRDLDLISIDVDGDDWIIWEAMRGRPRVVVIEYNASIPLGVILAQSPGEYFGCSAQWLIEVGRRKCYTLVAMTDSNCVFVGDDEVKPILQKYDVNPEHLFNPRYLCHAVSAFDGRVGLTATESAWGQFKIGQPIRLAKGDLFTAS